MELFDKNLGATILQLVLQFHEIERNLAENAGLTSDEMRCLMMVYLRRPSCVSELNNILLMDPTRTSKVLNSLEKQGLLKRELDTYDRRKSQIVISENGQKISEKTLVQSSEFCKKYFNSTSEELLQHLNFLLRNK